MVTKRKDYISWDEYFMGVAILAAKRSKDPNTQVGACIVDKNNVILTTGYNGYSTHQARISADPGSTWPSSLATNAPRR